MTIPTSVQLRRTVLAVSVLEDVDLLPRDDGVLLAGVPALWVSWSEVAEAVGAAEPESDDARRRVARWLRARRRLVDWSLDDLAGMARPVALPSGHALHPGPRWARMHVLGGALDVGLGFVGLDPARPDDGGGVAPGALTAAGVATDAWWPDAADYLERMGATAAERLRRNPLAALRPMGDCDVMTLLASATFRSAVVGDAACGMRAAVVPMRRRGWL